MGAGFTRLQNNSELYYAHKTIFSFLMAYAFSRLENLRIFIKLINPSLNFIYLFYFYYYYTYICSNLLFIMKIIYRSMYTWGTWHEKFALHNNFVHYIHFPEYCLFKIVITIIIVMIFVIITRYILSNIVILLNWIDMLVLKYVDKNLIL